MPWVFAVRMLRAILSVDMHAQSAMSRFNINSTSTLESLHSELVRVHDELADAREREIAAALARFKEEVELLGISEDRVSDALGFSRKKRKPIAQYYDSQSGKTWCGTGRRPKWLVGKDLEQYLLNVL